MSIRKSLSKLLENCFIDPKILELKMRPFACFKVLLFVLLVVLVGVCGFCRVRGLEA